MDGDLGSIEEKILKAIKAKTLTKEGIKRGLIALIDAEIDQQERPANMELINACQNILCDLNNQACGSNEKESLAQAQTKLALHYKRKSIYRRSIRIAAVFLILICGGFGLDVLMRQDPLIAQPTVDEQQIEIRGDKTQGVFFTDAQADTGMQVANVIGSDEIEDAAAILGYYPKVPTWMPEAWIPQDYFASTSQYASIFRMKYRHSTGENLIKYSETRYYDVEQALTAFQQSKNGEIQQWNGMSVYVAVNIDEPVAIWLVDSTCYSLSGPLNNDELERIIKSINRSETKYEN